MRPPTKTELMSDLTYFWTRANEDNKGMTAEEVKSFMRDTKLFLRSEGDLSKGSMCN